MYMDDSDSDDWIKSFSVYTGLDLLAAKWVMVATDFAHARARARAPLARALAHRHRGL